MPTKNKPLTGNGLREMLEHAQDSADNARPSVMQARGHVRRVHLEQSAEREHAELLVVHARERPISLESCEPLVEESARDARALGLERTERE